MRPDPLNIVVTGVGGQGNVLASTVLGRTFLNQGLKVTVGETYGLSQRGGPVMSQVRLTRRGSVGPLIPANGAHVVIGLEPLETLRIMPRLAGPETVVLANDRPIHPINVISGRAEYPDLTLVRSALDELTAALYWLPAVDRAQELGPPVLANVIMLGALLGAGVTPLDKSALLDVLSDMFSAEKFDLNKRAVEVGVELAAGA